MKKNLLLLIPLLVILGILSSCKARTSPTSTGLRVVATTSILADVVRQVGGDRVQVTTLVPVGVDEHSYQPAPLDIAAVADAGLVFKVGLGLEGFLDPIIQNAGKKVNIVDVSEGIKVKSFSQPGQADGHNEGFTGDPHVWMDPQNVVVWVRNISAALEKLDPDHASTYQKNSENYIRSLNELDGWISEQTKALPLEKRRIVTDHMLFGYFAEKYGFEVIGAIIPSYSTSAQPSAKELAALEDAIREFDVKVILVGNTLNPAVASRVAEDTGITLQPFYTGSLSKPDGPAGSYIDYMKFNVSAILAALKQ